MLYAAFDNVTNNITDSDSSVWVRVVYTCVAALLTLFTIIGNLYILIAVQVNYKFRRIRANILITNLAVADLLVGSMVMPLALDQMLTNGVLVLGHLVCKQWTAMNVIACTASISTLCMISVDRYIGVARPLEYFHIATRKKLWISVSCVWLFSILVWLAPVSWNDSYHYQITVTDNVTLPDINTKKCHLSEQLDYVIQSVLLSFFIPLFITLAFYYQIYRVAQTRKSNFVQTRSGVFKWKRSTMRSTMRNNVKFSACSVSYVPNTSYVSKLNYGGNSNGENKKHSKVAITLGLVVGAFVLCWLPFFVLFVIYEFCHCISIEVLEVFTWLGYCNSALNPLIYARTMKTFVPAKIRVSRH